MEAALVSALLAPSLRAFSAIRIELRSTGTTINLLDGSGSVSFPVNGQPVTFTGADPVFGTIGGIDAIAEQIASEAPTVSIAIYPPSANAIGELSQPENQGSSVRVWFGLVDDMTGIVIGTELIWSGRLDTVVSNIQPNAQSCELATVSAYDRLYMQNEGEALNGTWHKSIWPGETGLDFASERTSERMWGGEAPKPATTPIPVRASTSKGVNFWGR